MVKRKNRITLAEASQTELANELAKRFATNRDEPDGVTVGEWFTAQGESLICLKNGDELFLKVYDRFVAAVWAQETRNLSISFKPDGSFTTNLPSAELRSCLKLLADPARRQVLRVFRDMYRYSIKAKRRQKRQRYFEGLRDSHKEMLCGICLNCGKPLERTKRKRRFCNAPPRACSDRYKSKIKDAATKSTKQIELQISKWLEDIGTNVQAPKICLYCRQIPKKCRC